MSKPTARELLDGVAADYPHEGLLPAFAQLLAARVEKVLALQGAPIPDEAPGFNLYRYAIDRVVRLLDGEDA